MYYVVIFNFEVFRNSKMYENAMHKIFSAIENIYYETAIFLRMEISFSNEFSEHFLSNYQNVSSDKLSQIQILHAHRKIHNIFQIYSERGKMCVRH